MKGFKKTHVNFSYGFLKDFKYFPLEYTDFQDKKCALCDFVNIGRIIQPFSDQDWYYHEMCLLWSPSIEITREGKVSAKIWVEFLREVSQNTCLICKRKGATLKCQFKKSKCINCYHFGCFFMQDEKNPDKTALNPNRGSICLQHKFEILCPQHKRGIRYVEDEKKEKEKEKEKEVEEILQIQQNDGSSVIINNIDLEKPAPRKRVKKIETCATTSNQICYQSNRLIKQQNWFQPPQTPCFIIHDNGFVEEEHKPQ